MPAKSKQMPFRYLNRKGAVYYLRRVPAGTRPARWAMSRSPAGALDALPEGHEVVETPNGQVSLRRVRPRAITREEESWVQERLAASGLANYRVEVKNHDMVVHAPDGPSDVDLEYMMNPLGIPPEEWLAAWPRRLRGKASTKAVGEDTRRQQEAKMARLKITLTRYNPVLRFRLSDAETRHFIVSRMCFRGDSPRWLKLEDLSLAEGCDRYFPHLGRESFYELNLGGLA